MRVIPWPPGWVRNTLGAVDDVFSGIVERFLLASTGFERRLRTVRPEQWARPTPCAEWDVRLLVNHMTRGNLNYAALAKGGTAAEFARMRSVDALGDDPVGAFERSVRECADAYTAPGVLEAVLDFPLGPAQGKQALAVRTADAVVHTWDLARALGADEALDPGLVGWIDANMDVIYAGLAETPVAAATSHRFFAPSPAGPAAQTAQDRLLRRTGRDPS